MRELRGIYPFQALTCFQEPSVQVLHKETKTKRSSLSDFRTAGDPAADPPLASEGPEGSASAAPSPVSEALLTVLLPPASLQTAAGGAARPLGCSAQQHLKLKLSLNTQSFRISFMAEFLLTVR